MDARLLSLRDPKPMLEILLGTSAALISMRQNTKRTWQPGVNKRNLRLYAVACYRRLEDRLPDPIAKYAVGIAELSARGQTAENQLSEAHTQVKRALDPLDKVYRAKTGKDRDKLLPMHAALSLALQVTDPDPARAAWYATSNAHWTKAALENPGAVSYDSAFLAAENEEKAAQADLLREIFGKS